MDSTRKQSRKVTPKATPDASQRAAADMAARQATRESARRAAADVLDAGETPDAPEPPPVLQRPDGFYWQDEEGQQEFGPFESYELAEADRDAATEEAVAPGQVLRESEQEIGIADWIDAETGEPAEGQSPPHLQEE
jgi:hypothetical protein